jgi:hypothetical protein
MYIIGSPFTMGLLYVELSYIIFGKMILLTKPWKSSILCLGHIPHMGIFTIRAPKRMVYQKKECKGLFWIFITFIIS